MEKDEFIKILDTVAEENDADLYLFSGPVVPRSERLFNETLLRNKKRQNALCLTTTYGGSAAS